MSSPQAGARVAHFSLAMELNERADGHPYQVFFMRLLSTPLHQDPPQYFGTCPNCPETRVFSIIVDDEIDIRREKQAVLGRLREKGADLLKTFENSCSSDESSEESDINGQIENNWSDDSDSSNPGKGRKRIRAAPLPPAAIQKLKKYGGKKVTYYIFSFLQMVDGPCSASLPVA
jgi:hypothetical protein